MLHRTCTSTLFTLTLLLMTSIANAQESPWLLGDWDGRRTALSQKGIDFELVLTTEGIYNTTGGNTTGYRNLTNIDLIMDVNGKAFGLTEDSLFHLYFLGNYGADPTEMVGDVQGSSNIESPDTFKLYEIWWQQKFLNDQAEFLMGLHDYNSVFVALDTAGLFTNSSFGIGPDISQVPPSIFPTTSAVAMLSLFPTETTFVRGAIYDGFPGDEGGENHTQVTYKCKDGIFYALEGGFQNEETGTKLAVGGWYRTTDFKSDVNGKSYSNNAGYYLIAETSFADNLAGFFQFGNTDKNRNMIDLYVGTGINYSSLLADDDIFGLAVAYARGSDGFGKYNPNTDEYEMAIECTYEFHPTDFLTLQPDIQFIKNPSMDPSIDNALVLGLRAYISF